MGISKYKKCKRCEGQMEYSPEGEAYYCEDCGAEYYKMFGKWYWSFESMEWNGDSYETVNEEAVSQMIDDYNRSR